MKKPLILIAPSGHDFDPDSENRPRFTLFKNYAHAIVLAGGIPVMAATGEEPEEYADLCDGVMFTGGAGIHPSRYGGIFHEQWTVKGATNIPRDNMEFPLIEAFLQRKKPIFGICHGQHLINVALGGTLELNFPKNVGEEHQSGCCHMVKAEPDSVVGRLYGEEFMVNSYHRNRVLKLGEGLRVTAVSPAGVIEAIEHESLPILGVQWHPERAVSSMQAATPAGGPEMVSLFEYFLGLCREDK